MGLFLINGADCPKFMYEPVGFNWFNRFKEVLKVDQPLNGDKIKRYIENECGNKNNTFSFNDKPIQFEFISKIQRDHVYISILMNEWVLNHLYDLPNKKIKAEKIFKEDVCAICITNPANILFCKCGHLCVCKECAKIGEGFDKCPICNAENTNLRIIE